MTDFQTNSDIIQSLNTPVPVNVSADWFQPNSMTKVTSWFDEDCRRNGARQALESLYKHEYTSVFTQSPTPKLAAIQNTVDMNKKALKRSYVFITIRPKFESIPADKRYRYEQWCEDIEDSFRFIKNKHPDNLFRWETVNGDPTTKHFHAVFKLALGYSPKQMWTQLTGRKAVRQWFNPLPTIAVNVKKIDSYDYKTVAQYIIKGDFTETPK